MQPGKAMTVQGDGPVAAMRRAFSKKQDGNVKRLWLVRLGKNGEYEADALERSLLSIGFNMTADLSTAKDRDAVLGVIKKAAEQ